MSHRKNNERWRVNGYWASRERGVLITEYPVVSSKSDGTSRRRADAVIIDSPDHYVADKPISLQGKKVTLIEVKATKLSPVLLGQAFVHSKIVLEDLKPKSLKTVVLCREADTRLSKLAETLGIDVVAIAPEERGKLERLYHQSISGK
jgi:hypothetical protein